MNESVLQPVLRCLVFIAVMGILAFLAGRIVPKTWFQYDHFPYRCFPFEREGKIYEILGIRRWKDRLPDMSKLLPHWIPSKQMPRSATACQVEEMLRETCVAELVHWVLCLVGLRLLGLWKGLGGWIMYFLYLLGNIPFCIIQRYNRPKLARIYSRLQAKESVKLKEAVL